MKIFLIGITTSQSRNVTVFSKFITNNLLVSQKQVINQSIFGKIVILMEYLWYVILKSSALSGRMVIIFSKCQRHQMWEFSYEWVLNTTIMQAVICRGVSVPFLQLVIMLLWINNVSVCVFMIKNFKFTFFLHFFCFFYLCSLLSPCVNYTDISRRE